MQYQVWVYQVLAWEHNKFLFSKSARNEDDAVRIAIQESGDRRYVTIVERSHSNEDFRISESAWKKFVRS